jgi:thioredoxin reductase
MDKATQVDAMTGPGGEEYFKVTTQSGTSFVSRALIIATGAQPRFLDVPGAKDLLGLGLSYSAVSHAPLFWGKDTAVVGSDNLAFRSVAELSSVARQVYLVSPDRLPVETPWMTKVRSFDNVAIMEGAEVTQVAGSPYLETMTVRTAEGKEEQIPVKGLFVELSLIPNTGLIKHLVDVDDQGRIVVNCRGETSRNGIYAAGDVTNNYAEQVLIAIGAGATAVLAAYEYLLRQPAGQALPA